MNAKPKCPWCGTDMRPTHCFLGISRIPTQQKLVFSYFCPKDRTMSQSADTLEEARVLAMQRPKRQPLLLKEALNLTYVWLEMRGLSWPETIFPPIPCKLEEDPDSPEEVLCSFFGMEEQACNYVKNYGREYRFWDGKPTDEERNSAAWRN